ncbi:MAG: peptidylprolyl isomerase [Fimbriimonas sp.]
MRRLAVVVAFGLMGHAWGQIDPVRTYNGINLPFEVKVRARGEARIELLSAPDAKVLASVPVESGRVDLARLFPDLWATKQPKLVVVQLVEGTRRVGPGLILQPMTNPTISRLAADGKTLEFVPDEDQAFAGYRVWVDQNVVFRTTFGEIELRMRPDAAPNTAWNFLELVRGGFYRQIPWHRIVAIRPSNGQPFVIQAGDPTGTGNGGPGFAYALEKSPLEHDFGVISMARSTDPNTNGSQIFIALSREGTKHLDGRYAAFGEAIRGADVILKLAAVKVGKEDRPVEMPYILSARLVKAKPFGTGPARVVRPK